VGEAAVALHAVARRRHGLRPLLVDRGPAHRAAVGDVAGCEVGDAVGSVGDGWERLDGLRRVRGM
jgi:hypothetical protein